MADRCGTDWCARFLWKQNFYEVRRPGAHDALRSRAPPGQLSRRVCVVIMASCGALATSRLLAHSVTASSAAGPPCRGTLKEIPNWCAFRGEKFRATIAELRAFSIPEQFQVSCSNFRYSFFRYSLRLWELRMPRTGWTSYGVCGGCKYARRDFSLHRGRSLRFGKCCRGIVEDCPHQLD